VQIPNAMVTMYLFAYVNVILAKMPIQKWDTDFGAKIAYATIAISAFLTMKKYANVAIEVGMGNQGKVQLESSHSVSCLQDSRKTNPR